MDILAKRFLRESAVPKAVAAIFVAAILWLLAPTLATAQSSRGAIVGIVRDPSGASMPGATITITNIATNVKTLHHRRYRRLLCPVTAARALPD